MITMLHQYLSQQQHFISLCTTVNFQLQTHFLCKLSFTVLNICVKTTSNQGVRAKKVLFYLYTLRPFSLSPHKLLQETNDRTSITVANVFKNMFHIIYQNECLYFLYFDCWQQKYCLYHNNTVILTYPLMHSHLTLDQWLLHVCI